MSHPAPEPALADAAADGQPANTTGDTQVDAYLRDEMRRWQEDFGFDESVLVESIRRSIHAFRPFLLFRGGRDAIREVCRDAHDEADRSRRRLNRGGEFGQAGREETVQRGTYLSQLRSKRRPPTGCRTRHWKTSTRKFPPADGAAPRRTSSA